MSNLLQKLLETDALASPLPAGEAEQLVAGVLNAATNLEVYPRSIAAAHKSLFFLGRRKQEGQKYLAILSTHAESGAGFEGQTRALTLAGVELNLTIAPTSATNATALRKALPFLVARPLGLQKSVGCGDRLGLATPGHIRALRSSFDPASQSRMAPILAQQSIRENARTGRTPQEVMDDAMWGVFQEGWRDGFGADADHLKTTADVDLCVAAGYTFYTVDPGEYVDDSAHTAPPTGLQAKVETLPWMLLDSDPADLTSRLATRPIDLGAFSVRLGQEELLRAAAKYGRAVAHTVVMYRHLLEVTGQRPFELEMSVDETETVTSLAEHIYIAAELQRLGVQCVSLAPRYVGAFEKGVDYMGDLAQFERSFKEHLAVSQRFGPYKLSLHSGSDKFSVYRVAGRVAGELVHLKTAGTSYLEALRAIAALKPDLFREIVAFAIERFPTDRASYHISAEPAKMPDINALANDQLATMLDDFHARQVLHVTFGSVLNHEPFREPFFATLRANEEIYSQMIEAHFIKHFAPFK
jgi:hypothetical protein